MARISLLFCLITVFAFVHIINEASATQGDSKDSVTFLEMILRDVEDATRLLDKLQSVKEIKHEVKFLRKSEPILTQFLDIYQSGKATEKDSAVLYNKLSRFQNAWRVRASNAVVPERERKFMTVIERILKATEESKRKH